MRTGMPDPSRVPVIVGVGQISDTTTPPELARSPIELIRDAAMVAALDCGAGEALLRTLDSITVIRLFADSVARFKSPFGSMANPPWSLAKRLGAHPSELVYPPMGGDSPQLMVVRACERIANGESQAALIAGGEALRTELAAKRAGLALDWSEDAPCAPTVLADDKDMYSELEAAHGMRLPIAMYALIGQALRAAEHKSTVAYLNECGELFERFARVASANPLATRREGYSAQQLVTVSERNPYIGFPYTKLMIASAYIDQAAAILVVSQQRADELGIAQDKRVYLHGAAHAHEQWFVSERDQIHRSHAMRLVTRHALEQAGHQLDSITHFDLYSCFPSAVQVACRELGLSTYDRRELTVTGGLSFFGGPGNNYVTHAVAEMVQQLRRHPGGCGLVLANGGLLTKQAVGIYSKDVPDRAFHSDDAAIQAGIDRGPKVAVARIAQGDAVIESSCVLHGRNGPESGLLFGRLKSTGERFAANTPPDPAVLAMLQRDDVIGMPGRVNYNEGRNVFVPSGL